MAVESNPVAIGEANLDALREAISRLVRLRSERGLTQADVAHAMGTSQSAVARIERGRTCIRIDTLAGYAAAVGAELTVSSTAELAAVPTDLHPTAARDLFIGRALATVVRDHPIAARNLAVENLAKLRATHKGSAAEVWVDRWEHVITAGDAVEIEWLLSAVDDRADGMRHTNPFAGLLSEPIRQAALRDYRAWRDAAREPHPV